MTRASLQQQLKTVKKKFSDIAAMLVEGGGRRFHEISETVRYINYGLILPGSQ